MHHRRCTSRLLPPMWKQLNPIAPAILSEGIFFKNQIFGLMLSHLHHKSVACYFASEFCANNSIFLLVPNKKWIPTWLHCLLHLFPEGFCPQASTPLEFQMKFGVFENQFTEISMAKTTLDPLVYLFLHVPGPREEGPPDTNGQARETAEQQNREASLGESLRGDSRGIEVSNFLD